MRRHDSTQTLAGQSEGKLALGEAKLWWEGDKQRGVIALRCKYVDGLSVSE